MKEKDRSKAKGLKIAERVIRAKETYEKAKHDLERAEQAWDEFLRGSNRPSGSPLASEPRNSRIQKNVGARQGSHSSSILEALRRYAQPVHHGQIAQDTGINAESVRPTLWYLKRRGLAESMGRGIWKAVRKESS